jgi:hypothetical protein
MTLTVHPNLIQGSDDWLDQRRGMVTASQVGQLLTVRKLGAAEFACPSCGTGPFDPCVSKRDSSPIKTMHPERVEAARAADESVIEPAVSDYSRNLTLLLASERITGWTEPTYVSDDMLRGIDDEPRARDKYGTCYSPVAEVGLMVEDSWGFQIGYSPDGLVGDDGLIEVKSRRPKTHLATILADEVPDANMAQLQCGLLVSGRKWIDYVDWCGGMPMYVKRVYPQQDWFDAIIAAVDQFEQTVTEMIARYSRTTADMHSTERHIELEMVI